jgi:hypothetical protein
MIRRYVALKDFNFVTLTDLDDQFAKTVAYLADQNPLSILRNPDKMVLDVVAAVGASSIAFHSLSLGINPIILKVSPKGEGFRPIERH